MRGSRDKTNLVLDLNGEGGETALDIRPNREAASKSISRQRCMRNYLQTRIEPPALIRARLEERPRLRRRVVLLLELEGDKIALIRILVTVLDDEMVHAKSRHLRQRGECK